MKTTSSLFASNGSREDLQTGKNNDDSVQPNIETRRVVPLTPNAQRKLTVSYDLVQQCEEMQEATQGDSGTDTRIISRCRRIAMQSEILANIVADIMAIAGEPYYPEESWVATPLEAARLSVDEFIPAITADLKALTGYLESKLSDTCSDGANTRIEPENTEPFTYAVWEQGASVPAKTENRGLKS